MKIQFANRIANVEEYYFSKKLAEVKSLNTSEWPVINLGIGSPDQAPAPHVIDTLTTSAYAQGHHGYQSYKGIPELRKAISEFNQRIYNVSLDPDTMILPLMGSKEGIMHIAMAFINEGDEVLIPNPGYPTYASVAALVGANVRTYDHDESRGWQVDIDALRRQDLSRVKVMFVNFPHMPTGYVASRDELQALVDVARANNFLIVNDNPYSLVLNENPISILEMEGAHEVALELNSLSKSHNMAGWRMGWVAGNKVFIDAVLRVKSNMDSGMFLPLQLAATEALKQDTTWFHSLNNMYAKRKIIAKHILDILGCAYAEKQSGLFVWAKVPKTIQSVEEWIDELLYKTKVFITPGFIFGSNGDRFIRISLCSSEEVLKEAAMRLELYTQSQLRQDPSSVSYQSNGIH